MDHKGWRIGNLAVVTLAGLVAACGSRSPTAPSPTPTPVAIMGSARLGPDQLVAWFNGRQPRPAGVYSATVPLETLAGYFVEEGAAEGVTGDVAFMQSVVETAWFRFSGSIAAVSNNFAGIGATDTNPAPAMFPDARTGVRAQIQHLRAYADPSATTCTVPPLRNSCVDPRFDLVSRKARRQRGTRWVTATGRRRQPTPGASCSSTPRPWRSTASGSVIAPAAA